MNNTKKLQFKGHVSLGGVVFGSEVEHKYGTAVVHAKAGGLKRV